MALAPAFAEKTRTKIMYVAIKHLTIETMQATFVPKKQRLF